MGIKGLYGYCVREVKECYRTVNILEEIVKYRAEHDKDPVIIINLSTLSYHFKLNNQDLMCGYQLNKIKYDLEDFLDKLLMAGAKLEFVFKKTVADNHEFIKRRLRDYHICCEIIERISKVKSFEKLQKIYKRSDKFPYNALILVCLVQSAQKFGAVHGCNSIKGKPSAIQVELAIQKDAAWIMGLDTFYFLMPGSWKIWCDSQLNMSDMTIQELDPNILMTHLELTRKQTPLFASLTGDLQSDPRTVRKVVDHFGTKSFFPNAAKFINGLPPSSIDEKIEKVVEKIFGKVDARICNDFKKTIKSFEVDHDVVCKVDAKILDMVKNDFMSIAEEILTNQVIFISPTFLDLRSKDMKTINELVLPLIQKTAGILLKNLDDRELRSMMLLDRHDQEFVQLPVKPIFPDFDVPALEILLSGGMAAVNKMKLLFFLTDLPLTEDELMVIPKYFLVDCVILLYLIRHQSLTLLDARCIFKTLVEARNRMIPLDISTDYPEKINDRAFRCSFLYSKMYFFFHSCLSSIGLKNFCSEIQFDGVYFQKIYALNILQSEEEVVGKETEESKEVEKEDLKENKDPNGDDKKPNIDPVIEAYEEPAAGGTAEAVKVTPEAKKEVKESPEGKFEAELTKALKELAENIEKADDEQNSQLPDDNNINQTEIIDAFNAIILT